MKVSPSSSKKSHLFGWLVGALFGLWLLSGIYHVEPGENAVLLHWGRYVKTVGAGFYWLPTGIDKKYIVNTQRVRTDSYEGEALTQDAQNTVLIKLLVQYRIHDPNVYLFKIENANMTLRQAISASILQVVGESSFDDVLSSGSSRERINQRIESEINTRLQNYQTGITLVSVALEKVDVPEKLKPAFEETQKAAQEADLLREQAKNEGQQQMFVAQNEAKRLLLQAQAYKEQAVLRAQAEIARYLALLPAYKAAPALLKERLYFSTMDTILTKMPKIIVDSSIRSVINLPLEKLFDVSTYKLSKNKTEESPEPSPSVPVAANTAASTNKSIPEPVEKTAEIYGSGGYL